MATSSSKSIGRLGEALKYQRQGLGLTQQEVADLAGVSVNLLRQVEAGKPTVQLSKLLDILSAVGLQFSLQPGNAGIAFKEES